MTGATGNVGRNVVDLLLRAGVDVRATSRNPESLDLPAAVDVRRADLTDPETFTQAFRGVEKVFLYNQPSAIEGVMAAAKAAGVRYAVLLSSLAAAGRDPDHWIARWHRATEYAIEQSGLSWTFVRPGAFAVNSLLWAPSVKEGRPVRLHYAHSYLSSIHERDIAEVSTCALLQEGHDGATYHITGGDSITQAEQLALIGQAIGRELAFEDITGDEARAELRARFGPRLQELIQDGVIGPTDPPGIIETRIRYYLEALDGPDEIDRTVEKILGKPARTFAEWAEDHKADFTN
ncbi:NAD(P)H-binding protein [Micromonospora sp. WMMA1363]|uniref:NAD(P)H-binding protein n=1 Tax=Micromonospora sp. WMMA1363 TaxID=3053985 RepID=UPI00259D24F7|nr:NAD(P)H-binding protein [Micromonospora sp. WMMA1363]MDM4721015.1 NAD(P)H-binding protein [Micromonospora sp. WMMA1363]